MPEFQVPLSEISRQKHNRCSSVSRCIRVLETITNIICTIRNIICTLTEIMNKYFKMLLDAKAKAVLKQCGQRLR